MPIYPAPEKEGTMGPAQEHRPIKMPTIKEAKKGALKRGDGMEMQGKPAGMGTTTTTGFEDKFWVLVGYLPAVVFELKEPLKDD